MSKKLTRKRNLFVLLVIIVLACGAGLFETGALGGQKAKPATYPVPDITMTDPFVVNLADTDVQAYAQLSVALQLKPMTQSDLAVFQGSGSGESGSDGTASGGAALVAVDPEIRNAVIDATSSFTSSQLEAAGGKDRLRAAIMKDIRTTEARDAQLVPKDRRTADKPPYAVQDVFLSNFVVQAS